MLLITGVNGQLGFDLSMSTPDNIALNSSQLDITDLNKLKEIVENYEISLIINCASYNKVDLAEKEVEKCNRVNAIGPLNLASINRQFGTKIIHISTDYVFDGRKSTPYNETDKANPISVYGKSKLIGENNLLNNSDAALVFRTSWLYSAYGNNFVRKVIELSMVKSQFDVVCDQVGTPTYVKSLTRAILSSIRLFKSNQRGLYHFSNEGICSWYDFAHNIIESSSLRCKITPVYTNDFAAKSPNIVAHRPSYSVLNKDKIKQDLGIEIDHWQDGLKECINEIKNISL